VKCVSGVLNWWLWRKQEFLGSISAKNMFSIPNGICLKHLLLIIIILLGSTFFFQKDVFFAHTLIFFLLLRALFLLGVLQLDVQKCKPTRFYLGCFMTSCFEFL